MGRSYKSRSGGSRGSQGNSGGSRIVVLIVVLVLLIAVGIGIIIIMNPGAGITPVPGASVTPGSTYKVSDKFYNGVFADDIPLGGLTVQQAKQQIEAKQAEYVASAGVIITKDTQSWQFKISEVPYVFDTDAVIDEAWKQGRQGTDEERRKFIEQLPDNPVMLKTTVTADTSSLEQKVRDLAAPFTVAAVDAAYVPGSYDEKKPVGIGRLSFTPDVPGSRVDADALWTAVKKEFDDRTFGTVAMQVVPVPAAVTLAALQSEMQLVGSYETEIKNSSAARLTNIRLAGATINGKMLMPGEIFSMNDTTGPRTEAKGYQDAPVDKNGVEDVGLAGGVCQVSGTMYNAAISAGPNLIHIEERNHHSIPSAYMGLGKDATVDYGTKDLKFKNISGKPMLLIIYYDYDKKRKYDYHEHAEIYGIPDPEGAKYELVSKTVRTIPKKVTDQPIYVPNRGVPPGTTKAMGGRDGIVVDVYLQKTDKNGKVTKIKIYQDTYPATSDVIAYNYLDPKPTPIPSPTPSPEPSSTPVIGPTTETTPTPSPTPEPTPTPTA